MTKTISSSDLNRNAGGFLKLAESGETIEITRRGKVVAVLGPPTNPTVAYMDHIQEVHDEGARKRIAKAKPDPDRLRAADQDLVDSLGGDVMVDDWGLPVEGGIKGTVTKSHREGDVTVVDEMTVESVSVKPVGMEMGTSKKGAIANAKAQRDNFAEAGGGEPKYRQPSGLSKSQQAGGKYER